MDMPGDIGMNGGLTSYFGPNLTEAVHNGSVTVDRLDDMAQRIVASWYLVGQDKNYPAVNFDSWKDQNEHVDVQGEHYKLIRRMGAASTVLLKNKDGALPLKKPRSIALLGQDMSPAPNGPNGFPDRGEIWGTLAMGWGSGTVSRSSTMLARLTQDQLPVPRRPSPGHFRPRPEGPLGAQLELQQLGP